MGIENTLRFFQSPQLSFTIKIDPFTLIASPKMTKKENDCGDRFSQVHYRYRRLCYEMFCETNKCGPSDRDDDDDDDESEFQIHRKMLRRRHVRKEQKEMARRRKALEEQERSQERTCRENHRKEKSDEISIDPLVQVGCSDMDLSHDCPPPTHGISTHPPSPPPTTVDATFSSPDHKDHTVLRQSMVPNFSPIRSKKLRTRIL